MGNQLSTNKTRFTRNGKKRAIGMLFNVVAYRSSPGGTLLLSLLNVQRQVSVKYYRCIGFLSFSLTINDCKRSTVDEQKINELKKI